MSLKITIVDEKLDKSVEGFSSLKDFKVKEKLLAEVVRAELFNLRSGNAHTKIRSEVSGGGKKPWKQKGTGRARHGSSRSPIWVGGGVTFGPRNNRNWHKKINKSARVSALKTIIKDRLENKAVYQFSDKFDFPKTKDSVGIISQLVDKTKSKIKNLVIVYKTEDKEKTKGFQNTEISKINVENLKVHKLVASQALIFTPEAKAFLEKRFETK